MSIEKLYSTSEVAELLGVHIKTLQRWIRDGQIAALKVGSRYRVQESEVKRLTEGRKKKN